MAAKLVIKGVHVVPMGIANAFLIEGDDGSTLIDVGFRGKEAAVFGAIRGPGSLPDQLKHPIFTPATSRCGDAFPQSLGRQSGWLSPAVRSLLRA